MNMVTILPRSAWTTGSNGRVGRALDKNRVVGIALHYPAAGNVTFAGRTLEQIASLLRGWRDLHKRAPRNWADIGYNFAFDQAGRGWDLTGFNVGAHAGTIGNPTRIGILLVLGDNEQPSPEMIAAVRAFRTENVLTRYPKATKVEGHQQVPGNSTACPGRPVMALIAADVFTSSDGPTTPTTPQPKVATWGKPETWKIGATGLDVTRLGQRLVIHAKALGLPAPYKVGPGPEFTETDRAAVAAFQRAQGWTGDGADGYPGPLTFERLAADPAPAPTPKPPAKPTHQDITFLYANVAGYNADNAPGVTRWKANVDGIAALVNQRRPDLAMFVELSNRKQNPMLPRMDDRLKDYGRAKGSDGRYIYRRNGRIAVRASWVYEVKNQLNGDDKQMACVHFGVIGEKVEALVGVLHAEHESTRDSKTGKSGDQIRVEQGVESWKHLVAEAKKRGVPPQNVFLIGDFNSESWVADALADLGVRVRASANFTGWDRRSSKRFNYVTGIGDADGTGSTTQFTDHQFIAGTLRLTA